MQEQIFLSIRYEKFPKSRGRQLFNFYIVHAHDVRLVSTHAYDLAETECLDEFHQNKSLPRFDTIVFFVSSVCHCLPSHYLLVFTGLHILLSSLTSPPGSSFRLRLGVHRESRVQPSRLETGIQSEMENIKKRRFIESKEQPWSFNREQMQQGAHTHTHTQTSTHRSF